MAWPQWVGVLAAVLIAAASGSWIGDWFAARTRRKLDIQVEHVGDVQRAAETLVEFASVVAKRSYSGDASLDNELRRAGNSLEAAIAMIRGHDLGAGVREYVRIGEAFAGGDPDVPEVVEREKFRSIVQNLREARLLSPKER